MKKIFIALAAALVLCVPAFADAPYFADEPLAVTAANGTQYTLTSTSALTPVYYYLIYTSNGDLYLRCISEYEYAGVTCAIVHSDQSTSSTSYSCRNRIGDDTYGDGVLSFGTVPTFNKQLSIYPYGTSGSTINDDFLNWLQNPPVEGNATSFTVPRGNVLYFKVTANSEVKFVSNFAENSPLFGSTSFGPWGDTYQRISIENSLPAQGVTFPRSGSEAIVWDKGEPLNVFGQTKVGVYSDTFSPDQYVAFYNPAYQNISNGADGFGAVGVGSNVTVTGNFQFIRMYSLQQLYDTSYSPDDYEDYLNGTPDGDSVIWTDQDDVVSTPVSGGDNQEDEPISSVSLIETIRRILHNILSEIENIFTFGFSAIRDLVDLMDEFVATFDDLYEWLPEECYTLLIACVSVAIVIGVFKVFL